MLWAAIVLYVSLMPSSHVPRLLIPHIDKMVHLGMYTLLAGLTIYGWLRQQAIPALHQYAYIAIIVLLSSYGLVIELLQQWMAMGRCFEWADVAVNTTGVTLGLVGYRWMRG
jgi:VanZ family protein